MERSSPGPGILVERIYHDNAIIGGIHELHVPPHTSGIQSPLRI